METPNPAAKQTGDQIRGTSANITDAPFNSLDRGSHPCACWIKPFVNLAQSQDTQALQSLCRMHLEISTFKGQSDRARKRVAAPSEELDSQNETSMNNPKTHCALDTKRQRRHVSEDGQSNHIGQDLFRDADEEKAEHAILQACVDSAPNGKVARIPITNIEPARSFQSTGVSQAIKSIGTSDSESSDKKHSSQKVRADVPSPRFLGEVRNDDNVALRVTNEPLKAQAAEVDDKIPSSSLSRRHTLHKDEYPIPDPTASIDIGEL
ncbi:MAG: hypothetical protein Q9200_000011 [Gallowayella weberi]